MSKKIKLEDKDRLFWEGEPRNYFYVLGKGTVLISKLTEKGDESLINVLGEGELFPHTGFFRRSPYPGTATAKRNVTVLAIPIEGFESFILEKPELAFKIIQVMNEKIVYLQRKLNEVLSLNVESRLKSAFSYLSDIQGQVIQLTHQEIGNIIGASRETVSRQLKKWEHEGKVEVKKDRIIIKEDFEPH
ncbi:Crp/Fnr family transcriptional regulator [Salipaludibacillus sp. CUR1]|uniref:Crp/Fnr family transcriptional regulator n=1 Tax=Salipaludibacillus sp. CUR1 TaxID=2820003 RepID=UPI001E63117E|nr:Crp/Fnr family transcriptional regulator [Salipaludibacillus sp. CUR1]MCE7791053.1 Crp/Fnr family transcriptional regulator [Salipaludibacillus sp. CUR1]